MADPRTSLLAGLILVTAGGCATKRATAAYMPEPRTTEAQLLECAGYRTPPGGVGTVRAIELQYVVKPDGLVDATTIAVLKRPQASPDNQARLVQQARDAAKNCQYDPALRDGQPIAATVRKTFRFLI